MKLGKNTNKILAWMIAIVFVFNLSLFGIAGLGWTANAEDGEATEEVR